MFFLSTSAHFVTASSSHQVVLFSHYLFSLSAGLHRETLPRSAQIRQHLPELVGTTGASPSLCLHRLVAGDDSMKQSSSLTLQDPPPVVVSPTLQLEA